MRTSSAVASSALLSMTLLFLCQLPPMLEMDPDVPDPQDQSCSLQPEQVTVKTQKNAAITGSVAPGTGIPSRLP